MYDNFASLNQIYKVAENHSVSMSLEDSEKLSELLAQRILEEVGRPDLIVGLANGALLTTHICSEKLNVKSEMIYVRRQGSRIKQRLHRIKEIFGIPSSWILAGSLKYLWVKFQDRYSRLEDDGENENLRVKDMHVVVVDDCVVSGNSLQFVVKKLIKQGASRVTTAVLCWTEEEYGGQMIHPPDIFLHRKIQWYPWSSNSEYWDAYQAWLKERGIAVWK